MKKCLALSEVVDVCTGASHCNDSFFMYDVSVGGHMKKDALVNKLRSLYMITNTLPKKVQTYDGYLNFEGINYR
jgi:hypothetical protein